MGSSGSLAQTTVVMIQASKGRKPRDHFRTKRNCWPMNQGPSLMTFQQSSSSLNLMRKQSRPRSIHWSSPQGIHMALILKSRYLKPRDFPKALTIKVDCHGARVRFFSLLKRRITTQGSFGSSSKSEPTSSSFRCMFQSMCFSQSGDKWVRKSLYNLMGRCGQKSTEVDFCFLVLRTRWSVSSDERVEGAFSAIPELFFVG